MRPFLILCVLIATVFGKSYGRSVENIPVPVLKENQKVDDLMDKILGAKNNYDKNVCYILELFKGSDGYAYQVKKVKKEAVNILVNQRIRKLNFGCFSYRKYTIIVWTNSDFSDLITKTPQYITLDHVYQLETIPSVNTPSLQTWHYLYNNGQFVIEDGPPAAN